MVRLCTHACTTGKPVWTTCFVAFPCVAVGPRNKPDFVIKRVKTTVVPQPAVGLPHSSSVRALHPLLHFSSNMLLRVLCHGPNDRPLFALQGAVKRSAEDGDDRPPSPPRTMPRYG